MMYKLILLCKFKACWEGNDMYLKVFILLILSFHYDWCDDWWKFVVVARSFAPFWHVLKSLVEKLANLHMQLVHTWSDLIKDIVRYNEEQHKRHKAVSVTFSNTS